MEFLQEITLELNSNTAYTTIGAKQGDSGSRIVKASLLENGETYIIPEGVSAYFRLRKPDGKAIVNKATIEDNKVIIALTAQALAVAGRAYGDITLQTGTQVLSTVSFILIIMAAPQVADQIVSSSEFGYLNQIVSDATNIIYEAEAWAQGTRGGAPVVSTETFEPSYDSLVIDQLDVNETTFIQKVGHGAGLSRTYTFTYTDNNSWILKDRIVNGTTITENEPEAVSNINDYGIIVGLVGGVTAPNPNDWIKVLVEEPDNTFEHNSKYYADQAASSKQAIDNLTVSAETIPTTQSAEVIKTITQGVANFHFKIPKGETGDVYFMSFDIDVDSGELWMYKPDDPTTLDNIDFELNNNDGNLYFEILNNGGGS